MSIITKTLTAAAFMAAVAMSADAAPVKHVQREDAPAYSAGTKAYAAEPEKETWTDIGEGILRDDVLTYIYLMENYEFPVKVQESDQHPGRYRMINAYANHPILPSIYPAGAVYDKKVPLIIDATNPEQVYIEPCFMGCYTGTAARTNDPKHKDGEGYQEGAIWSMGGDYMLDNDGAWTPDDFDNIFGKVRDGAITFPKGAVLFQPWEPCMVDDNGNPYLETIWTTANKSGRFRLKLPGAPNVDVKIELLGQTPDQEGVDYELELQDDIAVLRVALVEGEDVAAAIEKIKAGTIDYEEITGSGRYTFPYFKDGRFTLVCVPYTEDGVARYESYLSKTFEFDLNGWVEKGEAVYTEGILCDSDMRAYGLILSRDTYNVKIQEFEETPGLYRLVNAYGPPYMNANDQNYDLSKNYYIEIDATDPSRVFLKKTEDFIGLDLRYGPMMVWSKADRLLKDENMTKEEVDEWELENGAVWGKVENNTITFPKKSLLLNFTFVRPETWYWANHQGNFAIKLPFNAVEEINSASDENAPKEYYTLDGMKVNGSNLNPGLYIVRQGSKAWKQVVK